MTNDEWLTAPMKCIVRGHDHNVRTIRELRQHNTGKVGKVVECPNGTYRWLVVDGHELNNALRSKKPKFGWKDQL